jgi:predicted HD superfamily hydrolase involved in NAD metabolism
MAEHEQATKKLPDLEAALDWVKGRISERRYQHVKGVAETAKLLAIKAGADPYRAELAGWLHDACKEEKSADLLKQARDFGLSLHAVEIQHPHILHGPVAAEVIKGELRINDEDFLDAIRQHTLGGVNMTKLCQIVFLADAAEPGRPDAYRQAIWQALARETELGLDVALDLGVRVACDLNLEDLIRHGRVIHPKTVEVRNFYLELTSDCC